MNAPPAVCTSGTTGRNLPPKHRLVLKRKGCPLLKLFEVFHCLFIGGTRWRLVGRATLLRSKGNSFLTVVFHHERACCCWLSSLPALLASVSSSPPSLFPISNTNIRLLHPVIQCTPLVWGLFYCFSFGNDARDLLSHTQVEVQRMLSTSFSSG